MTPIDASHRSGKEADRMAGCRARGPAAGARRRTAQATSLIRRAAEELFPGYFALVMATGALSIGTYSVPSILGFGIWPPVTSTRPSARSVAV